MSHLRIRALGLATLFLFLFMNSSCHLLRSEANFQIKVVNAAGEPLGDASVLIQKKLMAQTNSQGVANVSVDLPFDDPILVEVSKASDSLFYAPYFETVRLRRGSPTAFKLNATLYAVSTLATKERPPEEITPPPLEPAEAAPSDLSAPTEPPQDILNTETPQLAPVETSEEFQPEMEAQKALDRLNDTKIESQLLTVYVSSGQDLVGDATVLYGNLEQGQWLEGCTTNARGRCSISIAKDINQDSIHLLIRAPRHRAQSKIISLAHGDRVRIDLAKGDSLEVFAVQKRYQAIRGLAGIKVKAGGRLLGETDSFGYFTSPMASQDSSWKIELEAPNHLPAAVQNEVNTGGPATLVQHFQTPEAARPRCFLLPLAFSGEENQITRWERDLSEGISRHILSQPPFAEADLEVVGPLINKLDLSPQQLAKQGWQSLELRQEIEYVIRPQLILQPQPLLELALIDQNGEVKAAAQSFLPERIDPKQLRTVFRKLSSEIAQQLPFEGAIVEEIKDGYRINLGQQRGYGLRNGDQLALWGNIQEQGSRQQTFGEIGQATVNGVSDLKSQIRINQLRPKAVAMIGQTVVLKRPPQPASGGAFFFEIKDSADQKGLSQANVYFQKRWIGSTDSKGLVKIAQTALQRRGTLEILRSGYRSYTEEFIPGTRQEWIFPLKREAISIRVASQPPQALVKLNGRVLGRTPLTQNIALVGSEAQLEVIGDADYLPFSKQVSLGEEGLDYSGENTIRLEKDIRREARLLAEQKRIPEAIAVLEAVDEQNPLYTLAQHEIGELLLNRVQDPVKAAAAFHRVTSRPEIANFADKRFIGTHINEAVALYHAGEQIALVEPKTALSYWKQAIEIMDHAEPQLRFVPQDRYMQALHSLTYYRAISLHRTWALTQTAADLEKAHLAWKNYIQNSTLASPADRNYASLKKAETFFKHTQSLLNESQQATAKPAGSQSEINF